MDPVKVGTVPPYNNPRWAASVGAQSSVETPAQVYPSSTPVIRVIPAPEVAAAVGAALRGEIKCSCERIGGTCDTCTPHPAAAFTEKELVEMPREQFMELANAKLPDLNSKPTNPKDAIATMTKVPMGLLPDTVRVAGAMAFLEGALKYGRYNWRVAGVRASVYYDALMRHMVAWWNGQDEDPDSGLPHLWKAVSCLAVLLDAEAVGKLTDDRPPRADVAAVMDRMRPHIEAVRERYAHVQPKQYTIADTPEGV